MSRRSLMIVMGLVLLVAVAPARAELQQLPEYQPQAQCLSLVEQECQGCHYLSRVCRKLDKKTKRGWKATMRVMLRRGAVISKEDQKKIIDCLVEPTPALQAACKK